MNYKVAVVHGAYPKQVHAQNRAHVGADLYKGGKAQVVITTGKYEADDMAQIVFKDGVPENAIRTETRSRTTYQMLKNLVSQIFPELEDDMHRLELAYLISQDWHEERLLYIAERVLGKRYPYYFKPAPDGRSKEEINADAKLEGYKMWADKTSLFIPVFGGLINSSAYWVLSKVRR